MRERERERVRERERKKKDEIAHTNELCLTEPAEISSIEKAD